LINLCARLGAFFFVLWIVIRFQFLGIFPYGEIVNRLLTAGQNLKDKIDQYKKSTSEKIDAIGEDKSDGLFSIGHMAGDYRYYPKNIKKIKNRSSVKNVTELMCHSFDALHLSGIEIDVQRDKEGNIYVLHDKIENTDNLSEDHVKDYLSKNTLEIILNTFIEHQYHEQNKSIYIEIKCEGSDHLTDEEEKTIEGAVHIVDKVAKNHLGDELPPSFPFAFVSFNHAALQKVESCYTEKTKTTEGKVCPPLFFIAVSNRLIVRFVRLYKPFLSYIDKDGKLSQKLAKIKGLTGIWFDPSGIKNCSKVINKIREEWKEKNESELEVYISTYKLKKRNYLKRLETQGKALQGVQGLIYEFDLHEHPQPYRRWAFLTFLILTVGCWIYGSFWGVSGNELERVKIGEVYTNQDYAPGVILSLSYDQAKIAIDLLRGNKEKNPIHLIKCAQKWDDTFLVLYPIVFWLGFLLLRQNFKGKKLRFACVISAWTMFMLMPIDMIENSLFGVFLDQISNEWAFCTAAIAALLKSVILSIGILLLIIGSFWTSRRYFQILYYLRVPLIAISLLVILPLISWPTISNLMILSYWENLFISFQTVMALSICVFTARLTWHFIPYRFDTGDLSIKPSQTFDATSGLSVIIHPLKWLSSKMHVAYFTFLVMVLSLPLLVGYAYRSITDGEHFSYTIIALSVGAILGGLNCRWFNKDLNKESSMKFFDRFFFYLTKPIVRSHAVGYANDKSHVYRGHVIASRILWSLVLTSLIFLPLL